jgi:purine nucleosidase
MTGRDPVKIIMDVDTGVDDAMALALAFSSPEIELLGVTTVAGNVSLDQATKNTLKVLDFINATTTPVYRGMSAPLSRDHFDAAHFHGLDGLGGAALPESQRSAASMTAPEFIVQTVRENAGGISLVFVGPLTNLAVALLLEPELPRMVVQTVIMGGAFEVSGNATRWAEFNIAVDPEAARVVAESDLDATWIGLDVTHSANLYRSDWEQIGDGSSATALLVREVCRMSFAEKRHEEMHLHDPLAVGVAANSNFVTCDSTEVLVDSSVRDSAGMTRMVQGRGRRGNQVARSVDSRAFREFFGNRLGIPIAE